MANSILNTLGLLFLNDTFAMIISSWKSSSLRNDPKRPPSDCSRMRRSCVWWISNSYTRAEQLERMDESAREEIYIFCVWPPSINSDHQYHWIYMFTREIYKFHTTFWKKTAEKTEMKLRIFGRTFCHTNHLHKTMAWRVVSTLWFFSSEKNFWKVLPLES